MKIVDRVGLNVLDLHFEQSHTMKGFINKLFSKKSKSMNWNVINSDAVLNTIVEESNTQRVLIFKHSTRCSISSMALNRMERSWNESEMQGVSPYILDLIAYRSLSNRIAELFDVYHESPQVLVIENGKCIYTASHMGINYASLKQFASISAD